ncbi:Thioredoxin domain-containing protein EC-YbbN [Paramagnetospirillum magnetotacticum MS-1]|uniref:Thioredoxin n=1 Tax=Paramagnetospirillum magnetotacticum MS-1 TaxID=272627 RepID=A0A0C2YT06_PARME|nr:thioredoxin [Paramagnetospirillum magnetotacticum]KIL97860.1 Thioredoxin domain-containing protein EC-YbbN [Paramagnetospirillum magnetotacticum MS-1]
MDLIFNSGAKGAPGAAQGVPGELIKDTTTATFVADVIEMSQKVPVIVDFWATWCGPCKTLGPALEKVVREARGAVRMVKVDVDKNQDLAAQLRIQSVPTVYAFKGGRPVDAFTGAQPESQLKSFVKKLIAGGNAGPTIDDYIAEARQVLEEGDPQTAAGIFNQILQEAPDNASAMAGLLRCLIAVGQTEQAESMLKRLAPEIARHADIMAVATALELARHAGGVGEAAELRRRLAANADDHQARYDLALAYYAGGETEAAVDELLDLFKRDRAWNEDAARKQLVKIFEVLGFAHPLAKSGRARLSTLLFS